METLSPEVIEDLRHGRAPRERKLAICTGGGHLPPADRAEILAVLASDAKGLSIALVEAGKCRIEAGLNLGGDNSDTVTLDKVKPVAIITRGCSPKE